ncbi:dnaJ homolog subfamily C member 30, mitochondrial-like [Aphidius gifuensis]|uniref:dnaJ homolog subfamily C member 30, mitochondrial-like n=1 Tax=Aphidius gifuensis TaxID=684658 RepID=UPI001CDCD863|nr:dnaJ homolog subfamily C member 30, mitochondrial-like [Aphidius gifuensis]
MKCQIKIPWSSMFTKNMSSSAKTKNYYTNLDLTTNATQEEVKAAYFKLSMQYHPDKNNSDEAKIKFREISDAYEVLGNFNKRKNYDRGINVKTTAYKSHQPGENIKTEDITKEAFRARSEIFRHSSALNNQKIYDFDEWTKAHYGKLFRRSQFEKQELHRMMEINKRFSDSSDSKNEFPAVIFVVVVCFIMVMFGASVDSNFDYPEINEKTKK